MLATPGDLAIDEDTDSLGRQDQQSWPAWGAINEVRSAAEQVSPVLVGPDHGRLRLAERLAKVAAGGVSSQAVSHVSTEADERRWVTFGSRRPI